MPSWIPGDDYMINFRKGDPYTKVEEGYARLPGDGYAALHPELEASIRKTIPTSRSCAPWVTSLPTAGSTRRFTAD